jgi:hypothetical protein
VSACARCGEAWMTDEGEATCCRCVVCSAPVAPPAKPPPHAHTSADESLCEACVRYSFARSFCGGACGACRTVAFQTEECGFVACDLSAG